MTYSVTRLGAYDAMKQVMSDNGGSKVLLTCEQADGSGRKKLGMGSMLLCASGGGVLGGLAGNPAGTLGLPNLRYDTG